MLFIEPAPRLHSAADAIGFAINSGWTTASDICDIIVRSDSTISRWRNGETEPGFNEITKLVRGHPDPRVKMLFPGVMTATTPIVLAYADANGDFDKNGRVDGADALCAMIQAADEQTTALNQLSQKTACKRAITPLQALEFRTQIDSIMRLLSSAACIVDGEAMKSMRRGGGR
jgi:hypothetical protein